MSITIRILHIVSGDTWGGAESQLFGLISTLSEQPDIDTSVIVLNHGLLSKRLNTLAINCLFIDEDKHSTLGLLRALRRSIGDISPDIVHTHGYKQNILGSLAAFFHRRCLCVRTQHGDWEIPHRVFSMSYVLRSLDLLSAKTIQQGIVAVSEDLAHSLRRSISTDKITTIENGIDTAAIERSNVRRSAKTENEAYSIAYVGRMVPVKRVDLFLGAAAIIIERAKIAVVFNVFGDGPKLGEYQKLSQQLDLTDHVRFHGFVEQLTGQLSKCNLLVMTSDHEGLPMVLLEALYLKVPVVAPAVGGIPAVLPREYGELVNEQTATAYADAILACIRRDAELRRNIAYAPCVIERRYSTTTQGLAYERFYRRLLSQN